MSYMHIKYTVAMLTYTLHSVTRQCTAIALATLPYRSSTWSVRSLLCLSTGGMALLAVAPWITSGYSKHVHLRNLCWRHIPIILYVSFTLWHYSSDYIRKNLPSQWTILACCAERFVLPTKKFFTTTFGHSTTPYTDNAGIICITNDITNTLLHITIYRYS